MRILILIIIASGIIRCAGSKTLRDTVDLRVVKATSQKWAGGTEESGWGIAYRFEVVSDQPDVKFDSIWIVDRKYNVHQEVKEGRTKEGYHYILTADYRKQTEIETPLRVLNAPQYQGAALIIYKIKEGRYTKVVDEIKQLEPQYHP